MSRGRRSSPGAPMPAVPDIPAVLSGLLAYQCRFVVIGGAAVAYHGFLRMTKDVDIVPEPSEENLKRLWEALCAMDATPLAVGDLRPEEMPVPWSLEALLERGNWDLATRHGRVDILQYVEGKLETEEDYFALEERASVSDLGFGPVSFVGFDDLVDLKRLAGRDQDLTDIRALHEARGDTAT